MDVIKQKFLKLFLKDGRISKSLVIFIGLPTVGFLVFLVKYIMTFYQHLMPMLIYFSKPFLVSLVFVALFTPLMITFAHKTGALDVPDDRKMHSKPIPLLGGVAVYLGFVLNVIAFLALAS